MPLVSFLFSGNPELERCAVDHQAHILQGASGAHVGKLQIALATVDGAVIDPREVDAQSYGVSTEAAVLAYKTTRRIINRSYQSKPDAIVGIMTLAQLDADMTKAEADAMERLRVPPAKGCHGCGKFDTGSFQAGILAQRGVHLATSTHPHRLVQLHLGFALAADSAGSAVLPIVQVASGPPEPKLDVTVTGTNSAGVIDGTKYIMVPLRGKRTIHMSTQGVDCFLALPDTVSASFPLAIAPPKQIGNVNGFNVFMVSGSMNNVSASVDIELTGELTGRAQATIWNKNNTSPSFDKSRDVTITVKPRINRTINVVFPTDALGRRSTITEKDIQTAFTSISAFYKRWCNINLTLGDIIEHKVDQDLGDEVNFTNEVAKDLVAEEFTFARRSKLLKNSADVKDDVFKKTLYVVWKFKKTNAGTLAFTVPDNRMITENFEDRTEWTLTLAHEIGHSFGVPGVPNHPDPPGFLMTQFMEAVKPFMSLKCIEICNPVQNRRP